MRTRVTALLVVVAACGGRESGGQDRLSADWPQWQRIESSQPPAAWQVEEASFAFDAWEASVVVVGLSTTGETTTMRFDDASGGVLDVRLAALLAGPSASAIAEGDAVRVGLIRRQGFEGVAQGLVVRDSAGRLLLLYDDGGYGPAFYEDGARGGISVDRSLRGTGSGDGWASPEVTFGLDGESVVCAEGDSARLGESGFVVKVVVSREWTGQLVTDVDLSPLAYLVVRSVSW